MDKLNKLSLPATIRLLLNIRINNFLAVAILLFIFIIVFYTPIFKDYKTRNSINEANNLSYSQTKKNKEQDVGLLNTDFNSRATQQDISKAKNVLPEKFVLEENPTFNDVARAGCGDENLYINKEVQWKAQISNYAHTGGIRFIVVDEDHPKYSEANHGHFWGTFLASVDDPRYTDEGLKNWAEKWNSRWVDYILDVYGDAGSDERDWDTQFLVDATIEYVNCEEVSDNKVLYDGGYIETWVKKITITKQQANN
jgi:archaellum component FlaF (FlaF/FlaG flagellin family)